MSKPPPPLAIVTGASTGIGHELALRCAEEGFDLLVAADEPGSYEAAPYAKSFMTTFTYWSVSRRNFS